MHITEIEYNVLMQAINNAKSSIQDDEFIDPYGENPDGYTNDSLLIALESIEDKLMAYYLSQHND